MEPEKYTNLQLELINLFRHEVSEKELLEIKELLGIYFAQKATEEADKLWDKKGWTNELMDKLAHAHFRKKERK